MDNDIDARGQIAKARKLIRDGRYQDARRVLNNVHHPLARQLLLDIATLQDEPPDVIEPTPEPRRKRRKSDEEEDIEIRTVIKRGRKSIWDIDENVPPIILKIMAFNMLLWLMVIPAIAIIREGQFLYLPFLLICLPIIPIILIIHYILWKFYWMWQAIVSLFSLMFAIVVILMVLLERWIIPYDQLLNR